MPISFEPSTNENISDQCLLFKELFNNVRSNFRKECAVCFYKAEKSCSKCKVAKYCDKECQSKHWNIHKSICDQTDFGNQYKDLLQRFRNYCQYYPFGTSFPETEFYDIYVNDSLTWDDVMEFHVLASSCEIGHLFKDLRETTTASKLLNFFGGLARDFCGPWRTLCLIKDDEKFIYVNFSPCTCCSHKECGRSLLNTNLTKAVKNSNITEISILDIAENYNSESKMMKSITAEYLIAGFAYETIRLNCKKICNPVIKIGSSRYCGKEAKKKCSECGIAKYCSTDCQKRDWKTHRLVCERYSTSSQNDYKQFSQIFLELCKLRQKKGNQIPLKIKFFIVTTKLDSNILAEFLKNVRFGHDFAPKEPNSPIQILLNTLGALSKTLCTKPHMIFMMNERDYFIQTFKICNCHDHSECLQSA